MKFWPQKRKRINLDQHGRTMVELAGRPVPLRIRRHRRARSLILRLENDGSGAVVTVPYGVAYAEAVDLAHARAAWILDHLDNRAPQVAFTDGAVVPYLGVDHVVRPATERRGVVRREDGVLWVAGAGEHLPRRLGDWLRAEARRELGDRARTKAALIDRKVARVTVRDMRSRWGSCGEDGTIAFSWRLIMAPVAIVDYVVAHEVAHLAHMDHSARFWEAAARLTDTNIEAAQAWLNADGNDLFRYG